MTILTKIAPKSLTATALALAAGAALLPSGAAQAGRAHALTETPAETPAQTSTETGAIVVTSQAALQDWQNDATRRLNRALARSPAERSGTPRAGIVQVAFTLGADGRPSGITVLNTDRAISAGRVARQSAIYAVRRMGVLSDVPVADTGNARFLANIVFANDRAERRELTAALARSERARIAAGPAEGDYIVLGG